MNYEVVAIVCALTGPCSEHESLVTRYGRLVPTEQQCRDEGYALLLGTIKPDAAVRVAVLCPVKEKSDERVR